MDGHTASITQLTLAKFLEGGHFGAYVRKMRSIYVARRDTLASMMDEYLSEYVTCETPAGNANALSPEARHIRERNSHRRPPRGC